MTLPRRPVLRSALAVLALLAACDGVDPGARPTPSASASPTPTPSATDPTIAAAGDVACDRATADAPTPPALECGQRATAALLEAGSFTAVLELGDGQYQRGTLADYRAVYDATWGRVKAITYPVPGNHEYETSGATGYYEYFGDIARDPTRGYYSFDLGSWHLVALNSNCGAVGGCGTSSPQGRWLQADLAEHPTGCTLAYWHHPRFSSALHNNNDAYDGFWRLLYAAGADVVLVGHDHVYERFAPQTPDATPDPARGIREFVVGTGGRSHYPFTTIRANSEMRNNSTYGVLSMTLHPDGYDWRFIPVAGSSFFDSGSGACH